VEPHLIELPAPQSLEEELRNDSIGNNKPAKAMQLRYEAPFWPGVLGPWPGAEAVAGSTDRQQ